MEEPIISSDSKLETCVICMENRAAAHFLSADGCNHRYCFSCIKQQAKVKLHQGMMPKCLHEGCNIELKITTCEKFLSPELIEIMTQLMKEASIPVTEKIYCPYPRCSFLMSKTEVAENSRISFAGTECLGASVCVKCRGQFCISCRVPWHSNVTCSEYEGSNPIPLVEFATLKDLAKRNLWRHCLKCNHMIELAAGCFHVTCRCGYEFCYKCGAEYKDKKAMCNCPLWEEQHILYA